MATVNGVRFPVVREQLRVGPDERGNDAGVKTLGEVADRPALRRNEPAINERVAGSEESGEECVEVAKFGVGAHVRSLVQRPAPSGRLALPQ